MLRKERKNMTKGLKEVLDIMDKGSFVEIGARACDKETSIYSPEVVFGSDGVVTGYGTVNGKAVFIFCQDEDVMGGTVGAAHAGKIKRLYKMAQKTGAPVIGIINSKGFRIEEAVDGLEAFADLYKEVLKAKSKVLQIIIKDKSSVGSMAVLAETADFILERGKTENPNVISRLLDILPLSKERENEPGDIKDDLNRLCKGMREENISPVDFLKEISDDRFIQEYKPGIGMKTVTAFIRLAGRTVGAVVGGTGEKGDLWMDVQDVEKIAQFINLCSSFNIGILSAGSNCGVDMEGAKEPGMIKALCQLAENIVKAKVPKVSILMGDWSGLGYTLMGSKAFAMDVVFAWPQARVMMINPNQAVSIICPGLKPADISDKAAEYEHSCCNVDFLLERGYADKAIDPEESRKYVIGAFETFYGTY